LKNLLLLEYRGTKLNKFKWYHITTSQYGVLRRRQHSRAAIAVTVVTLWDSVSEAIDDQLQTLHQVETLDTHTHLTLPLG